MHCLRKNPALPLSPHALRGDRSHRFANPKTGWRHWPHERLCPRFSDRWEGVTTTIANDLQVQPCFNLRELTRPYLYNFVMASVYFDLATDMMAVMTRSWLHDNASVNRGEVTSLVARGPGERPKGGLYEASELRSVQEAVPFLGPGQIYAAYPQSALKPEFATLTCWIQPIDSEKKLRGFH